MSPPQTPRCMRHPDKRRYASALEAAAALNDIEQRRIAGDRPVPEAPLAPALCLTCRGWHLVRVHRTVAPAGGENT
ncbi:MAG: hypothetical protein ACTHOD_02640 [Motilibacteraceae bacterium]